MSGFKSKYDWSEYVMLRYLLIIRCFTFEMDPLYDSATLKNTPELLHFKLEINFSSLL